MNRTLRHSACTPHFRVAAWLAWLIMAMAPAHGMPAGTMGGAHPATMISSMAPARAGASLRLSGVASDCCASQLYLGKGATDTCHGAATCVVALPLTGMQELGPVAPVTPQAPAHGPQASGGVHAPPLRPPMSRAARST